MTRSEQVKLMVEALGTIEETLILNADVFLHNLGQYRQYGNVAPEVQIASREAYHSLKECALALEKSKAALNTFWMPEENTDYVDLSKDIQKLP